MKVVELDISITNIDRLKREIVTDPTIGQHFNGIASQTEPQPKVFFHFEDSFDSADETYLRFTFVPAFVDEDNSEDFEPSILDIAISEAGQKYFHNIDYDKELSVYLQRNETWGVGNEKGLLLAVEYFSDIEKTNPILRVDIQYSQDPFGNLVSKQTTRCWYMRNGQIHPEKKEKPFAKIYTPTQSRNATDRRRHNIIAQLEADLINLLVSAAGEDQQQQGLNLQLGVQFLSDAAEAINTFYRSGNIDDIVAFVTDAQTVATYDFLLLEVAPGVTAQQYIIAGVTY